MTKDQHQVVVTNAKNSALNLVVINFAAQILVKLSSTNYPSWHAQFYSLLFGYDLLGFVYGNKPCPLETIMYC